MHKNAVILALLALSACAEPVDAQLVEAVEPADEETMRFAATRTLSPWLILTDVQITDAGGDWDWEPGEDAIITGRLVNTRSRDFMWYPGVAVSADHAGVEVDGGSSWFYGIFGRTSHEISFPVTATGLSRGDVVTFTLSTTALGCDNGGVCPAADTVTLQAQLQ